MKKYIILIMTIAVFLLSGCMIETRDFFELDESQRQAIIDEIKEKIEKEAPMVIHPDLAEVENLIVHVVETNEKAIVGISNIVRNNLSYDVKSTGSGFIYDYEAKGDHYRYYVITNAHVVEDADRLEIVLYDGTTIQASTIFESRIYVLDVETDIAVISFEYDEPLKVVEFTDSDNIRKGQFAIAVGNPLGYDYFGSVTFGVVSGLAREVRHGYFQTPVIQHDAAISPGNSGGPLFDINGRVIGVNNMKVVRENVSGIGFAIPSNTARQIAKTLREEGEVLRAAIGIYYIPNKVVEGGGIEVEDIILGGAAQLAGIRKGDVIIRFDDKEIQTSKDLAEALAESKPGQTVTVVVRRGGQELSFNVTLQQKTYE